MAPHSYSILLSSCVFITNLILMVQRSKCSIGHMENVSLQLILLTLDPVPSATPLVVSQYARATQACPVEASIPMCSVTASVLLSWQPSQHLGMVLLHTL